MAGGCGHKSGQKDLYAILSKRFAGTLCVTGFAQKLVLCFFCSVGSYVCVTANMDNQLV